MRNFKTAPMSAAVILAVAASSPGFAQSPSDSLERLKRLEERIDELERKNTKVGPSGTDLGVVRSAGGGSLVVGGYVKADFIYDLDETVGDLFVPEALSIGDASDEEHFTAHARQTRIFIKGVTPSSLGDINGLIEGDFFGSGGNEIFSNSHSFRLRHATIEVGGLRVGQYWTTFMPIESYPSTVDFQGPAGIPFIRQAQVRYTHDLTDNFSVAVAAENSEFSGRSAAGTISETTTVGLSAGLDGLPDFIATAAYKDDLFFLKVAGVARELNSPGDLDSDFGWGINISGNAELWEGGKILGSYTFGDGVGRYILNGFANDAFVDAAGQLTTIESQGVTVGLEQKLTETLTGNLAFGYYDVSDTFAPTDTESLKTVHASLFWRPDPQITFGAEVIYGEREIANGLSDDAVRFQTSVQYNF